jgi:hypothetical protein
VPEHFQLYSVESGEHVQEDGEWDLQVQ